MSQNKSKQSEKDKNTAAKPQHTEEVLRDFGVFGKLSKVDLSADDEEIDYSIYAQQSQRF